MGLFHSYLYRQRPDIRGNWQRSWGGGHVVENQIHPIDLARYLIGEVRSVYARYAEHVLAGTEDWDNWDSYSVTLEFEGERWAASLPRTRLPPHPAEQRGGHRRRGIGAALPLGAPGGVLS